jgi:hypothetical protein
LKPFWPGTGNRREFVGETGRAGLTALNIPLMIDLSATGAPRLGSDGSLADRLDKYSEKVR